MNKNDSELMESSFRNNGFIKAESPDDAKIIVYNTCSVRQHAEDRVIARINSAKNSIRNRGGLIVVAGCMAQRTGQSLTRDKVADLVVGPYESPRIGEIIKIYLNEKNRNSFLSQNYDNFSRRINIKNVTENDKNIWHKWVTITHGCENFCSYCIVPYVRGKLISFKSESIIEYIRSLSLSGIKEITLLGQNVNQYGTDNGDIPFYKLLDKVAETEGILKINFITSHPKDFSENIISVIKDHSNISRSIHLPLQSGSDRILDLMNRQYNMKHYMKIIEKIDKELRNYSITTDLIVGFPGESEEDYSETLKYVKDIRFDDAYMYAYSPRENTPAFELEDSITRNEKIERLNKLIGIQKKISQKKLRARIDKTESMIVERISKKSDSQVMGKTFLNHPVVLPGSDQDIGKNIIIKIKSLKGATLQGIRIV